MARGRKRLSECASTPVEPAAAAVVPPPAQASQQPPAPARKIELIITTRRQAAKAQQEQQIKAESAKKEHQNQLATRSGRVSKAEASKVNEKNQETSTEDQTTSIDEQESKIEKHLNEMLRNKNDLEIVKAELLNETVNDLATRKEIVKPSPKQTKPRLERTMSTRRRNIKNDGPEKTKENQIDDSSSTSLDSSTRSSISLDCGPLNHQESAESMTIKSKEHFEESSADESHLSHDDSEIIKVIEIVDNADVQDDDDDSKEYEVMYVEEVIEDSNDEIVKDIPSENIEETTNSESTDNDDIFVAVEDDSQESEEYLLVEISQDSSNDDVPIENDIVVENPNENVFTVNDIPASNDSTVYDSTSQEDKSMKQMIVIQKNAQSASQEDQLIEQIIAAEKSATKKNEIEIPMDTNTNENESIGRKSTRRNVRSTKLHNLNSLNQPDRVTRRRKYDFEKNIGLEEKGILENVVVENKIEKLEKIDSEESTNVIEKITIDTTEISISEQHDFQDNQACDKNVGISITTDTDETSFITKESVQIENEIKNPIIADDTTLICTYNVDQIQTKEPITIEDTKPTRKSGRQSKKTEKALNLSKEEKLKTKNVSFDGEKKVRQYRRKAVKEDLSLKEINVENVEMEKSSIVAINKELDKNQQYQLTEKVLKNSTKIENLNDKDDIIEKSVDQTVIADIAIEKNERDHEPIKNSEMQTDSSIADERVEEKVDEIEIIEDRYTPNFKTSIIEDKLEMKTSITDDLIKASQKKSSLVIDVDCQSSLGEVENQILEAKAVNTIDNQVSKTVELSLKDVIEFIDINMESLSIDTSNVEHSSQSHDKLVKEEKLEVNAHQSPKAEFEQKILPELEEKLQDFKITENIEIIKSEDDDDKKPSETIIDAIGGKTSPTQPQYDTNPSNSESIVRNVYAEAFAGLSSEARNHIYEALMRTKTDIIPDNNIDKSLDSTKKHSTTTDDSSSGTEREKRDKQIRFDPIRNIFVTEDVVSKKFKKSLKKEQGTREKECKKKKEKEIMAKEKEKMAKEKERKEKEKKEEEEKEVRRSSRIQTISQTKKRSHGHGLVRDRDRFMNPGGGEMNVYNNVDDANNSTDQSNIDSSHDYDSSFTNSLTETELKARLVATEEMVSEKEMEERLCKFITIRDNIYHCDRNISKEAKKMLCDCFLTQDEIGRGELGCGEDCLNRLLMIECGPKCVVSDRCTNRKFQKIQYAKCRVFRTEKKGFGIMADSVIPPGEFIMEYVGEVLNSEQFEKRANEYSKDKNRHYYFMALRSDAVIDATLKGNISRFINHSCDPNAETQKWTVNGELRIGFFSTRTILKGEELTFDYQFQRYGKEAQKCYCEAENCRGWIGEEPDSEEEIEEEVEEEVEEQIEDAEEMKEVTGEVTSSVLVSEAGDEVLKVTDPSLVVSEDSEKTVSVSESVTQPKITVTKKIVKVKRVKKVKKPRPEIFDDADLDDEIDVLTRTGLKNQVHTLKLSRLMVRAKQMEIRSKMLNLLQSGEMPCRRLFLDYHGLRLLYGWMCDSVSKENDMQYLKLQFLLLETLKSLPISNKTMLKDSRVYHIVEKWSQNKITSNGSPNDDTPSDSGSGTPQQSANSSPTDRSVIFNEKKDTTPENSSCSSDEAGIFLKKNIIDLSSKLVREWKTLTESFRIPKKERIEQMKEHEREANLRYKALGLPKEEPEMSKYDRYRERKNRQLHERRERRKSDKKSMNRSSGNNNRDHGPSNLKHFNHMNKHQRRQMFEMKFAQEQQEKKKQEIWRLHEMKCRCFGIDPRLIAPENAPAMVNPATGQWFTSDHRPVAPPPSHAHIKPLDPVLSVNPDDYVLPTIDLPPFWKFALTTKGKIYYYHTKIRIPQWEPPIFLPPLSMMEDDKLDDAQGSNKKSRNGTDEDVDISNYISSSEDSSDSSEDEIVEQIAFMKSNLQKFGKNVPKIEITEDELQKCLNEIKLRMANVELGDANVLTRLDIGKAATSKRGKKKKKKKKRREGLVQERIISPRTLEDKIYGQQQTRLYRETKEKLRKRKEEMRKRKMMEIAGSSSDRKKSKLTDGLPTVLPTIDDSPDSDDEFNVTDRRKTKLSFMPMQPLDLDNPEEFVETLISKSIEHDAKFLDEIKEISKDKPPKKNVYEEWKKQAAKLKLEQQRKRELQKSGTCSSGSKDTTHCKKRKLGYDSDLTSEDARKIKEKFRTDIAGVIVQHLTPYRKDSCQTGRINGDEDFKHLARKLTHFVMLKELKHCDNTVNILEVTDSVKIKSREFIKKYMAKYGSTYKRGDNEPDFRE